MTDQAEFNPIYASTSCFTIGHLNQVSYYIFQHKDVSAAPSGQKSASPTPQPDHNSSAGGSGIYEVESKVRSQFPEAVMFAYTKEIYLYDLNCTTPPRDDNDAEEGSHVVDRFTSALTASKIEMELASSGTFHSKTIFNNTPHQQTSQQPSTSPNKALPLIYINFLKAVKRFIIWKLSHFKDQSGKTPYVTAFGNHAICSYQGSYRLALIDPIYNFNDELLMNVCLRSQTFYRLTSATGNTNIQNCAIHLAPSAVRVYLANEDLHTSISEVQPHNSSKLLDLLKDFCNIDLTEVEDLKWIRVVPNLSHLNQLTPNVSQYLKEFNSGLKYIVWPLQLCFYQEVHHEPIAETQGDITSKTDAFEDMFEIIDQFVEYNEQQEKIHKKDLESISAMHTPSSLVGHTPVAMIETPHSFDALHMSSVPGNEVKEENLDDQVMHERNEEIAGDEEVVSDDKWDTELFGNDEDEDEDMEDMEANGNGSDEGLRNNDPESRSKDANAGTSHTPPNDLDFFTDALLDEEIDKYFSDDDVGADLVSPDKNQVQDGSVQPKRESAPESENSVIDKNQAASFIDTTRFMETAGTDNSLYEDPGAPAPVPFAIIAERAGNQDGDISEADRKKSVFAPLNFNPAIESSIDSKYSNGGKFYVPHDSDADTLVTDTNDTSVKSYTPVTPSLRKGKFDSSVIFSSSDESESSEGEGYDDNRDDADDDDDEDEDGIFERDDETSASRQREFNDQGNTTGLGLINFKREDMAAGGDKLSNLALSSPMRKADLSLATPLAGSQINSSGSSPAGSQTSENQNWLPFLLKLIPLHTLPSIFLRENPVIKKSELEDVVSVLLRIFAFDCLGGDLQASEKTPHGFACLKFKNSYVNPAHKEFVEFIAACFPGVTRTPLADFVKQRSDNEFITTKSFECLTGAGLGSSMKENDVSNQGIFDSAVGNTGLIGSDPFATPQDQANYNQSLKYLFQIPQPLIRLRRMNGSMNINLASLKFWNLLNLQPSESQKSFDVLLIVPRFGKACADNSFTEKTTDFLGSLIEEYNSSRLGKIEKLDLPESKETSDDINGETSTSFSDGIYEIRSEKETDDRTMWSIVFEQTIKLAKRLKSFPPPTLRAEEPNQVALLVVNPSNTFSSLVEVAKLVAGFKRELKEDAASDLTDQENKKKKRKISQAKVSTVDQAPVYEYDIFAKVLALDLFYSAEQTYTIISSSTLNKLALELYNMGVSSSTRESESLIKNPFTTVSPGLPEKIAYKLTKSNIARSLNSNDLYIHLVYERSIDKNWCVASWSDQYGNITNVKAWYCPSPPLGSKASSSAQFKSFEAISNEIWELTLSYIRSHTGKSYLVLTRLSNIIPDDELIHWKRLSLKTKNLLLIVLAVNLNSNLVLSSDDIYDAVLNSGSTPAAGTQGKDSGGRRPDSVPSNTGLTPFLIGNGDSPEMYMNGGGLGATGTPIDISSPTAIQTPQASRLHGQVSGTVNGNTEDLSVVDITDDSFGFILPNPISLSNQQNRISIKTGYLMKASVQKPSKSTVPPSELGTNNVGNEAFTPTPNPNQFSQYGQGFQQTRLQQGSNSKYQKTKTPNGEMKHFIRSSNILEVNLMSCPSFVNGFDLIKEILHQYRDLASLAECWGMNGAGNLHLTDSSEEMLVPWHILSVSKCLNGLIHVNVAD